MTPDEHVRIAERWLGWRRLHAWPAGAWVEDVPGFDTPRIVAAGDANLGHRLETWRGYGAILEAARRRELYVEIHWGWLRLLERGPHVFASPIVRAEVEYDQDAPWESMARAALAVLDDEDER